MSPSPASPSIEAVTEILKGVEDPELHRDLVSLGMVKQIDINGARVAVEIELTTPACPLKNQIGDDVKAAITGAWPDAEVEVSFGARVRSGGARQGQERERLGDVKNVVLIASGKGGVGKSTVAVNLAYALRDLGAAVGLADTDVYGPSMHLMTGVDQPPRPSPDGPQMLPALASGLPVVSMGLLVDPGQAVIWRGPMLASAAMQLIKDVAWGPLDYLIVDLPPGTGDVQLSIAQKIQVAGAVVVSTPQDVALADVERAKAMFDKLDVETLGVIENMSYFICDGCNKRHDIFASGGAEAAAERLGTAFFGALPIDIGLRQGSDSGRPLVLEAPESEVGLRFKQIAGQVAARLAVLAQSGARPDHLRVVQ